MICCNLTTGTMLQVPISGMTFRVDIALHPMWTHMWKYVCKSVYCNSPIANHMPSDPEKRPNHNKVQQDRFENEGLTPRNIWCLYEKGSNVITYTTREKKKGNSRIFPNFPWERETERFYLGVSKITGVHLASAVIWDRTGGKERDEKHTRKNNIVKIRWKHFSEAH